MTSPPPEEPAFSFLRLNARQTKPRNRGITEIRGPYYSAYGPRRLEDLLEIAGPHIDTLKIGPPLATLPRAVLRKMIDRCHAHDVTVSTGGFTEFVVAQRGDAVRKYLDECRVLGLDVVEVSNGFIGLPADGLVALTRAVVGAGLVAKPEVGIQFGAGGSSGRSALAAAGTRDVTGAVELAQRHLDAGASIVMLESEGITEDVDDWRVDVIERFVSTLGLDRLMFEAADPPVFTWYVKTYGVEVNLFVDHSQIVQLECLRVGAWGTNETWGRLFTYPDQPEEKT